MSPSVQTLVQPSRQWSIKHCCLFFAQVATEASFTIVRWSALWYWFGVELVGLCYRSVKSGRSGITAGAVFVCVRHGQNDHSGIRRGSQVLSPASDFEDSFDSRHVLHLQKRMDDPPNGRFWTLTPDGDVYPEMLLVQGQQQRLSRVARWEEQTYSDDNDACWPPLGAGLWIWSSQANFLS